MLSPSSDAKEPTVNDPQDTDTLTDEEIETRRFDTAKTAPTADAGDDTGDDATDTGDDSGDVSDTSDTGDDSGDSGEDPAPGA
jgi:hypothetical protein